MNKEHWKIDVELYKLLYSGAEITWYGCGPHSGMELCIFLDVTTKEQAEEVNLYFLPCRYDRGWQIIPDYAGDWAAMGALIEEMNNRGLCVTAQSDTDEKCAWVGEEFAVGATLPHAVALAARRALEA